MGLLDALSSDDAKLGIALLSASGYSPTPMSFGQRLGGALGQYNADKTASSERALKLKLLQSQVDENASQNMLRQGQLERQKRQDAYFMGDVGGGGGVAPMTAPGGAPQAQGGVAPGSALAPPGTPPPGRGKFAEWSQQYGIPVDALVSDYFSNGGKGIADMLMKRGMPDMKVQDGYAYNANTIQPGFLPGITTSANGTSTLRLPDPFAPGGVRVAAPLGALGAAGAYAEQEARIRAGYTPGRPTILPGGRMGGQSQLSEIQGGPPAAAPNGSPTSFTGLPPAQAGVTGNFGGDQSRIIAAIADIKDPQERSNALAAFEQQMKAAPASSVAGGGLEFSPDEKTAQAAAQARAVDTSKADVVRDTTDQKKAKSAGAMIAAADRAIDLLKQGPTASGLGEMVDKGAAFFGRSNQGAQIAAKLDIVSGELVNNVPRMEGPQSDGDRLEYKTQAGRAADRSLPTDQRLAAMQEVKRLQLKYAGLNGGVPEATQQASKSFKDFGYSSQAEAIKDAQNAMMRNPGARVEILRRLDAMGVKLPESKTGSW